MRESDLLYETAHHYIVRGPKGKGYEVYRIGVTHAVRCATIGFEGQKGLDRAKEEIARREA